MVMFSKKDNNSLTIIIKIMSHFREMHKGEGSENTWYKPVLFSKALKVVKSKGDKDSTCPATLQRTLLENGWNLHWTL